MPPEINDGLTDSERDILAELDSETDDDLDNLRSVAAGDDAEDDNGDESDNGNTNANNPGDDGEEGEGNDKGASSGDVAAKPDAEATDASEQEDDGGAAQPESKPLAPIYQAQAPDNLDQQLKDVMAERRAARKAYEEGDLTEEAYDAKLDELDQRRDTINSIRIKAQVSAEMTQQQLQQSYKATVSTFMKDMAKAGINYQDPKNAEIVKYLDSRVRALASAETEESPEVWRRVLDEAHELTAKRFGLQTKKAAEEPAKDAGDKTKKATTESKDRKPDLAGMPPTIGRGPGAANEGAVDAEFSHLEGLSGIELEKAVAKLTPEQLNRYLP